MNALNWFELFVSDFDRARTFYARILNADLPVESGAPGGSMAMFPFDMENGVGGCLTLSTEQKPGAGGTRVYLNVNGQLDTVLDRVTNAGGTILTGKTAIPPHGFIAVIRDTEGNEVGLHSL